MAELSEFQIAYLAENPHCVETLARWHVAEWRTLLPHWSEEKAIAELNSHRQNRAIPTTLVAFHGEDLAGSVSLLTEDHDELPDYTPWLASLYVHPKFRGLGLGAALCSRLVEEAGQLGVKRLFLYTQFHEEFYLKLGWRKIANVTLEGGPATLMVLDIDTTRV